MTDFLSVVGKRAAEQWLALLALPGLLLVAAVAAAHTLGQRRSLDVRLLTQAGDQLASHYQDRAVPALVTGVVIAAAAAAAGVLARGLGTALETVWLARILPAPAGRLLDRGSAARQRRWTAADDRYRAARQAHAGDQILAELAGARNRIALVRPTHPTWMGDRLALAGSRVYQQYGLDLQFTWPRLWLVLPELARTEIREARSSLTAAAILQAWGLMYLALGIAWWPAAACGAFAALLGWRRGRAAAAALADLVESAFDLYNRDLAAALGFKPPPAGPVDRISASPELASGAVINELIRKGS